MEGRTDEVQERVILCWPWPLAWAVPGEAAGGQHLLWSVEGFKRSSVLFAMAVGR